MSLINNDSYYASKSFFEINMTEKYLEVEKTKKYFFLEKEDLKKDNTLYLYIEGGQDTTKKSLFVKFGEARKQTIFERYDQVTGNSANSRMIKVWKSSIIDKDIHNILKSIGASPKNKYPENFGFRWTGDKDDSELNTEESYEVYSLEGLEKLISAIDTFSKSSGTIKRKNDKLFPDVAEEVAQICQDIIIGKKTFLLDYCPRWGKTRTDIEVFLSRGYNICYLCSYIKTVGTSYKKELEEQLSYENTVYIDPDANKYKTDKGYDTSLVIQDVKDAIDRQKQVFYYIALTGDEDIFLRRVSEVQKLKKYSSLIIFEEADFGLHTSTQVNKEHKLIQQVSPKVIISTTGTNAFKANTICDYDTYRRKDYILDVLNSRQNAVGLDWRIFDNTDMYQFFSHNDKLMENFNEIFRVENHELVGRDWLKHCIELFFKPEYAEMDILSRFPDKQKEISIFFDSIRSAIDTHFATMIFTPNGRNNNEEEVDETEDPTSPSYESQWLLKELIESIDPNYVVRIINGDPRNNVTNETAEKIAKDFIRTNPNKQIFFIASGMANRSFSVPDIKNIFLFINGGSGASISQKISRGLSPKGNRLDLVNHIIDFRFGQNDPRLFTYLQDEAKRNLFVKNSKSEKELLETILATRKLNLLQYSLLGKSPFKKLSYEDIGNILHSDPSYVKLRQLKVFYNIQNFMNEPRLPGPEVTITSKTDKLYKSVKGDEFKNIYRRVSKTLDEEDEEETRKTTNDAKLRHFEFLQNYSNLFYSGNWDKDILKNEFKSMSENRKKTISSQYHLDMRFMTDLIKLLEKYNILASFDDLILQEIL